MTNPVILLGTQSNGETFPVQVDATGRLVAEGLEGPPGPQGEPFTYDDFTPEQLEQLQGPPGPPGPDDLKPYGPENSYLIIQNGKPTWVSSGPGPEPPEPQHEVMLYDNREVPRPLTGQFGSWNDQQDLVEPAQTWDEYLRLQSTFDNPYPKKTGLGGLPPGSDEPVNYDFKLSLVGGFNKVLQLTVAGYWNQTASSGYKASAYVDVTTAETNLSPIVTSSSIRNGESSLRTAQLTYLVSRPDIGVVDFSLQFLTDDPSRKKVEWGYLQRWEYIDASVYVLQQIAKKNSIATADLVDEVSSSNS